LASPRATVGFSGNNKLVITIIPVNKCIILYSYLMGVQAIDQNIFPRYWERPKCSIARGQHLI
jgi:hypothetical protein